MRYTNALGIHRWTSLTSLAIPWHGDLAFLCKAFIPRQTVGIDQSNVTVKVRLFSKGLTADFCRFPAVSCPGFTRCRVGTASIEQTLVCHQPRQRQGPRLGSFAFGHPGGLAGVPLVTTKGSSLISSYFTFKGYRVLA
jgi:hypothetical protein